MNSITPGATGPARLYQLLPELYRWRDQNNGTPLQAFLAILESEYQALTTDISATYDNWFIQTCDNWVVPYIAELLGVEDAAQGAQLPFTQRRRVANTIAYRRRKGTPAILEQVLWDVTNWHVSVVEFYRRLATTQHGRIQASTAATVNLHDGVALADGVGPLASLTCCADLRKITVNAMTDHAATAPPPPVDRHQPGLYNRDNVGIYFWRIRAYPVDQATPFVVHEQYAADEPSATNSAKANFFSFAPAGYRRPLLNRPTALRSLTVQATKENLPIPITRAALAADLQHHTRQVKQATRGAQPAALDHANSQFYGPARALHIAQVTPGCGSNPSAVPPDAVAVANLNRKLTAEQLRLQYPQKTVLVDPELGRLAWLGDALNANELVINYTYGFSADIGGGPYPRHDQVSTTELPRCEIRVATGCVDSPRWTAEGNRIFQASSFGHALFLWHDYCQQQRDQPRGLIHLLDNGVYALAKEQAAIWLPPQAELAIVASDGVQPTLDGSQSPLQIQTERPGYLTQPLALAQGQQATATTSTQTGITITDRRLTLSGLRLVGNLEFTATNARAAQQVNLLACNIEHCTLLGALEIAPDDHKAPACVITIDHSIVGRVEIPAAVAALQITDSIIDGTIIDSKDHPSIDRKQAQGVETSTAICMKGALSSGQTPPTVTLVRSTILGKSWLPRVDLITDVIFAAPLTVENTLSGTVRSSYLPAESITPPCSHCLHEAECSTHNSECQRHVTPLLFTATTYGQPGYAQLSQGCALMIREGSDHRAEIGVFAQLYQPQRAANIQRMLDQYLPLGLNVGITYVT